MRRLTIDQARRAALGASGLLRPRPTKPDVRHFRRVVQDLDVVQLDSVNVVTRAHELMFFSRIGSYDTDVLRHWLWQSREVFECWAHVASMMSVEAWPLLRHRQLENDHPWKSVQQMMQEDPGYIEAIRTEVTERGPRGLTELDDAGQRSTEQYWGWSPGKFALHWLFEAGQIAVHERTSTFAARFDALENVIPPAVLTIPDVPREEATRALLMRAVRAQAVATIEDLADHHRLPIREARAAGEALVASGDLIEVDVEGWTKQGLTHADLVIPRSSNARALMVPFDPLVWFRPRLSRLWHFDYTIEIYVPAAKRKYGYYVLPFLLGDALVARVDLKADRKTGRLLARGAWLESGVTDSDRVASALADELRLMGEWLGTPEVVVEEKGDLAKALSLSICRG